ncbi:hypothetical protein HQ325_16560 [Rhodococcus sp. BP-349]|uniref:hypothetical protein n=1 Tax=unclassified Rhodococcus (in: high G+C Gram-positive bacteria) TaxID=192944 RepID=UPI001C9A3706|nr:MULTISPECIES: hypothetical protein [unclassified Rhodococcus (in: high G+C Gram-positive bacteria)]MBY6540288.1 hypothetical protein [Rhodococcus sp. BP-363]MBY6545687.1 hypothetical protein [Rhodococcus sp. BP-369]MBY6564917.1 hypothetical protein [Rhodococcus sp. BP-370]MBY6578147.1 hypothetical protein [Rhodococcus sp. BP-364]MBY6587448.1 hypothetical protein [Rhodococcus sp. BP-358]
MTEQIPDDPDPTNLDGIAELEEPIIEGDEPRTAQDYVRDSQVGVDPDEEFAVDPDVSVTEGGWMSGS